MSGLPDRTGKLPLAGVLDLKQIADCDIFVSKARPEKKGQRLFGGQVLAQSLVAAARTVPIEQPVHSCHCYFLLAGAAQTPILFEVTRIRDGRSFSTRLVVAKQENKAIFSMDISFHRTEEGPAFQIPLQDKR
jgi:acyl-CoA thioesterase-2